VLNTSSPLSPITYLYSFLISSPLLSLSLLSLSSFLITSLSALSPSRVRLWQWGLDVRTTVHAALSALKWLRKRGLVDADTLPSSTLEQGSQQTVEKENIKEGDDSHIFREHYNRHSQWIQRARKICVITTSASASASKSNTVKDPKSFLQLLSPLYLEQRVQSPELKVQGPEQKVQGLCDEGLKAKDGCGNTGGGDAGGRGSGRGSGGGSGGGSCDDLQDADWSEALSGERRRVQHSVLKCSAVQCSTVQCSVILCSVMLYIVV
jgi:uncharacterized membrane protein YgcG